jgi:hypothetical protein
MAGYTRQSASSIINGSDITAPPLNAEFNKVVDTFNNTTGHKHDGTAAEGPVIGLIGDPGVAAPLNKVVVDNTNNRIGVFVDASGAGSTVEQVRIQDGAIVPVTDNDIDLGSSSVEFKDLYLDGTAHVDTLDVDANATVAGTFGVTGNSTLSGNLVVTGNTTLGNAASDTVTVTADVASPLIPSADDTYDLGASGSEWRNLYVDGTANIDALVADTADINGGSVDGAVIGAASAAAGTFTDLTATGTFAPSTVDINAGAIDGTVIGANSAAAITGTTITGSSLVGDVTGNADTATALATARTIGGVSFDGTGNINLAGVNTAGNQDTSGNAATATALATARTIGGVSFDGSANIDLAGVNATGNQDTSGNAATATALETARTIAGQSFNGTGNITIAATDLSDTDQSLATGDTVQFAQVTTTGNAIVGGNLTVNGTTTTVDTTNMVVSDALIELGSGTTGTPSNDAGLVIERGDSANAFIGYDESADKFKVGTGTFTGASTGNLSITTGTLVANVEGAVTGNASTATALATARNIAGQSFDGTGNISIAPTDLTGVNSTAAELNIMDGDTSASSTTLADADRVVVNDAGTMKQVALSDFETYMETSLDTLSNVTTVGALNAGSITSGFGAIDNGSSAITTTGTINFGSLADGSITITGFVDEDDMSSNSATLIPTQQSVEARIQAVNGTANNVTGLNASGAEINTVADPDTSIGTTAVAGGDGIVTQDTSGNVMLQTTVDTFDTYLSQTTKTLTNKTLTSPVVTGMHLNDSGFTVEGSGADGNETTVAFTNPTADRTITLPDATGNLAVFTTAPTAAISDGSSGQFLTTNGSGALSFADAGGGAFAYTRAAKTADYTIVAGDLGKIIDVTANDVTLTLTAAATLGDGFYVHITNTATDATHEITIATNGSETIDGMQSRTVRLNEGVQLVCDGSNFFSLRGEINGLSTNFSEQSHYLNQPRASGTNALALGYQTVASGNFTTAIGYQAVASGTSSDAFGSSAYATADYSLALGAGHATGYESVAIGGSSTAALSSGQDSIAIGNNAVASGNGSKAIGSNAKATGIQSTVINTGSATTTASNYGAVCIGSGIKSAQIGKYAFGWKPFALEGDCQGGMMILKCATTDATPTAMFTGTNGVTSDAQLVAASDTCITFHGTVVAMQNGAQAYAGWEIKGMLVNDGGTTTLALGNVSDMAATNASSWAVALSADNTYNALKIQVTGEASHNIRWVANVHTSEVTYA